MHIDDKRDHHGHRGINAGIGLKVPADVIRAKCLPYLHRGRPVVPSPVSRPCLSDSGPLLPGSQENADLELEAAFSGQKAVQRVRRIIELSGHRSIHAAAKATGVQALSTQLLRVERATGFPIYERGVMPLTATIRGHAFIQDAKQVLAELDRHGNLSEARSDIGSPPPAANGA